MYSKTRKLERQLYLTKDGLRSLMQKYRCYESIGEIINAKAITVKRRCVRFGLLTWPKPAKKKESKGKSSPQVKTK